jgi:maleate isomerase
VRETKRVGLIVPSSNTTIETEIPRMLRAAGHDEVTFHSSRAVLHNVDAESLDRMVSDSDRCALELSDARPDVIAYACLVALMARGGRAHEHVERHLSEVASDNAGVAVPVTSSAGALIRALQGARVDRVAIMTPYMPPLTEMVKRYIEDYGIEVVDALSLSVSDNVAVGCLPTAALPGHAAGMDLSRAQLLIASACVQMPSLDALPELEERLGLPVISAATATTAEVLEALSLPRTVPGAGALLAQV